MNSEDRFLGPVGLVLCPALIYLVVTSGYSNFINIILSFLAAVAGAYAGLFIVSIGEDAPRSFTRPLVYSLVFAPFALIVHSVGATVTNDHDFLSPGPWLIGAIPFLAILLFRSAMERLSRATSNDP